jgi:hypothetical protein
MANVLGNLRNSNLQAPSTRGAAIGGHPLSALRSGQGKDSAPITQQSQVRQYFGTQDHDFVETKEKMKTNKYHIQFMNQYDSKLKTTMKQMDTSANEDVNYRLYM